MARSVYHPILTVSFFPDSSRIRLVTVRFSSACSGKGLVWELLRAGLGSACTL